MFPRVEVVTRLDAFWRYRRVAEEGIFVPGRTRTRTRRGLRAIEINGVRILSQGFGLTAMGVGAAEGEVEDGCP